MHSPPGRRSSTIVAVRQFRDRDSASSTAKKAGNEADQQSSELLDKANAYVDDLKVPQSSNLFVVQGHYHQASFIGISAGPAGVAAVCAHT